MTLAVGGRDRIFLAHNDEAASRIRLVFCLIAALITGLLVLASASSLLADPDNWWHVRVGLDLLENRSFPVVDTYSHTFAGEPWIAKEWLGQILLALSYAAAGWNGVALVTIASVALMVFLLAWYVSADLKPMTALIVALAVALLASPLYNARPIVLTLPITVVWTAELFKAARERRVPPLWLLPLLCLWANLHAAFTFGFIIAFFAGLEVLRQTRLTEPRLIAGWIAFGLLCPLVSMIHPYGLDAILATLSVASGNEAVPLIGEWQPFNATSDPLQEGAMLLAYLGLLVAGLRVGWVKALLFIAALHLFFTHSRFMYLPFLLAPITMAPDIAAQYPHLSAGRSAAARDGLERFFANHLAITIGCLAIIVTAAVSALMAQPPLAPSSKTSADGAIAYARQHGLTTGNVLNSYDLGGTLIFNRIKTFIDGRTDQLFLGGFMTQDTNSGASVGKPILVEALKKYAIDWALLVKDDARRPFFDELPGWSRVYSDKETVVYARNKP
jgi:hypothetical protein